MNEKVSSNKVCENKLRLLEKSELPGQAGKKVVIIRFYAPQSLRTETIEKVTDFGVFTCHNSFHENYAISQYGISWKAYIPGSKIEETPPFKSNFQAIEAYKEGKYCTDKTLMLPTHIFLLEQSVSDCEKYLADGEFYLALGEIHNFIRAITLVAVNYETEKAEYISAFNVIYEILRYWENRTQRTFIEISKLAL